MAGLHQYVDVPATTVNFEAMDVPLGIHQAMRGFNLHEGYGRAFGFLPLHQ